jgi:hypothetical protein
MRSAPHSPQVAAHHARMYSAFAAHCCADFAHAAHDPLRSAQPFGSVTGPASAIGTGTAVTAGLGGCADSEPVPGCPSPAGSGDIGAATSLGISVGNGRSRAGTATSAGARTASACVGVAVTGADVGLCSGRTGARTGVAVSSAAAGMNSGGSVGRADGGGVPLRGASDCASFCGCRCESHEPGQSTRFWTRTSIHAARSSVYART